VGLYKAFASQEREDTGKQIEIHERATQLGFLLNFAAELARVHPLNRD
jgi:hypothetical protein